MIRIAILATALLVGCCNSLHKSPLVLEDDLWVISSNESSSTTQPQLVFKTGTPSIEFLTDGHLQGLSYCNNFKGQYTTKIRNTGNNINIVIENTTTSQCEHNAQEADYLKKLQQATNYIIQNERLELLDSIGNVSISFVLASTIQKK